jgi:protein-tyrosine phosphatase
MVSDSEYAKLDVYFDDVSDVIHTHREKGGKTLVHCAAGEPC